MKPRKNLTNFRYPSEIILFYFLRRRSFVFPHCIGILKHLAVGHEYKKTCRPKVLFVRQAVTDVKCERVWGRTFQKEKNAFRQLWMIPKNGMKNPNNMMWSPFFFKFNSSFTVRRSGLCVGRNHLRSVWWDHKIRCVLLLRWCDNIRTVWCDLCFCSVFVFCIQYSKQIFTRSLQIRNDSTNLSADVCEWSRRCFSAIAVYLSVQNRVVFLTYLLLLGIFSWIIQILIPIILIRSMIVWKPQVLSEE